MQSARWIVPSLLALALVAVGAAPALAGSHEGVTMPDKVTVEGTSLVLNGMGLREATMFKVDVYVAGLYVEKKSSNGEAIVSARSAKRIHLQFKRDVDRKDMVKALEGAFNKNAGSKKAALSGEMKTFKSWLTKLDEGDTLVVKRRGELPSGRVQPADYPAFRAKVLKADEALTKKIRIRL